jgi:DNA-binding response OmpR family regulator
MRVLLISDSRLVCTVVAQCLQPYALLPQVIELEATLAAGDRPVAILHAPRWDATACAAVEQLVMCASAVFVISPAAARWVLRLAMAEQGAVDGFPEDRTALRLLALQVQRAVLRGQSGRLELGPLVLDATHGTLGTGKRVQKLTPDEVRLLAVLWTTADIASAGLAGEQLSQLARMPEPSVRNHVAYLRRRLEDLVGDTVAIMQERGRGYRLVLRDDGGSESVGCDN